MPPEGPADVAAAWMRKADSDRRTLEILAASDGPPWDMVSFHAQQLAEKSLEALLSRLERPFPRTHDLSLLARALGDVLPIAPDDPELVELSYLAVAPRYPFEDDVTPGVARTAIRTALRIHAMVTEALGRETR